MWTGILLAIPATHNVIATVVTEVTALTPIAKVRETIVLNVAINVATCKDHEATGFRMWLMILGSAVRMFFRSFTAVAGTLTNKPDYECPLWMVFVVIDWHGQLQ